MEENLKHYRAGLQVSTWQNRNMPMGSMALVGLEGRRLLAFHWKHYNGDK
jgi:hypothetical protein